MTYIVLEGGDGCGKSTQAREIVRWLESEGRVVSHVREPGSTPLAESLRALLLEDSGRDIEPVTEALLFSAARRELMIRTIRPALARGEVVVAERSFVSTIVYQCLAPSNPEDRAAINVVTEMTRFVHGDTWPDAVIVLDVAHDIGQGRVRGRDEMDRIEQHGAGFAQRVREAFVEFAGSPQLASLVGADAIHLVDANRDVTEVHDAVRAIVANALRGAPS